MKAVVLRRPCAANELKTEEVPVPDVKKGWVLVKVKAFGINRSELFTRKGQSPSVNCRALSASSAWAKSPIRPTAI